MVISKPLKHLDYTEAMREVAEGAVMADLRPIDDYLDVHIPGSLELLYEFGPGMASRARDCIPLDVPLLLLDEGTGDMANAAAALKGKGFTVVGKVTEALARWAQQHGSPASTEIATRDETPTGFVLDVSDPGARRDAADGRIPIERLWDRASEATEHEIVVVAAGAGVRAALAVGILERAGVREIVFWKPG